MTETKTEQKPDMDAIAERVERDFKEFTAWPPEGDSRAELFGRMQPDEPWDVLSGPSERSLVSFAAAAGNDRAALYAYARTLEAKVERLETELKPWRGRIAAKKFTDSMEAAQ